MASHIPAGKPFLIGLYGVPGSGKTFLCNRLRTQISPSTCTIFDGSEVLGSIVPGGIAAFGGLDEKDRTAWRAKAIEKMADECRGRDVVGVVAGHFIFWDEQQHKNGPAVWTRQDQDTYSYVVYLNQPPELVVEYRATDPKRTRPQITAARVKQWQDAEQDGLLQVHRDHGIGFATVSSSEAALRKITQIVRFVSRSSGQNMAAARNALDRAVLSSLADTDIALVFDADRTLAPQAAGSTILRPELLQAHFKAHGYSHRAFQLATALYEQHHADDTFESLCGVDAARIALYPDMVQLLTQARACSQISIFVITCGLRRVWEKVLRREGFSGDVTLIGGGRFADGLVVTPEVKTELVARLRDTHGRRVYAFGDSPLDLGMLQQAGRAVVVVGDDETRSKTMDRDLAAAVGNGLVARQAIVVPGASPRLDPARLPVTTLADEFGEILQSLPDITQPSCGPWVHSPPPRFFHATDRESSKLLATPTRDAGISGPTLREHHRRIGFYLATELVAKAVGLETIPVPHVRGHVTQGHRLCHEDKTAIVAIMRGGEPMALGVSDAFPHAVFVHADAPGGMTPRHTDGMATVVLVDSVINSGRTAVEFVARARSLNKAVRIVVVAAVVQADSVVPGGAMERMLAAEANVWLVALRVSETSFTGSGTTDTGNRLFNTAHLD